MSHPIGHTSNVPMSHPIAHTKHLDPTSPSPWVVRFVALVRPGGRVLDLACGQGRHSLLLAARGFEVLAVDRDAAALEGLAATPNLTTRVADLESGAWPFAGDQFDAIVVTHYLHRPLFPHLLAALSPEGVLIYETFAAGNERFGRPSNPDFLLLPGELIARANGPLTIVAFEQGWIAGERPVVIQRLAAVGSRYVWPPPLPA